MTPDATGQRSEDWVAVGPVVSPTSLSDCPRAPSIHLDGIRFSYRGAGSPVLLDISTTLEPGLVYVLDGANGSGKSTLAKLLAGVLRPQSGAMSLNGSTFQPWREPGTVFAYHFQNPDLQLFSTTVRAEVEAGPRALGLSSDTVGRAARVWGNAFGLEGALDWHPLDLPFVYRKRVALAATFAMVRPWLILDEPTLGQDDETSETIRQMIGALADQGCGILVISHSVGFRERLGGHRLVLKGGRLGGQ
jgi:energy-coupling factor transport system ATP-binding protein